MQACGVVQGCSSAELVKGIGYGIATLGLLCGYDEAVYGNLMQTKPLKADLASWILCQVYGVTQNFRIDYGTHRQVHYLLGDKGHGTFSTLSSGWLCQ